MKTAFAPFFREFVLPECAQSCTAPCRELFVFGKNVLPAKAPDNSGPDRACPYQIVLYRLKPIILGVVS